jgi:hypothetical protein
VNRLDSNDVSHNNSSLLFNSTLLSNFTNGLNNSVIIPSHNSTSNPSSLLNDKNIIKFHFFSIILLFFSGIAIIPPVWLNTLNLMYGQVDSIRKRKIMQIMTEMINTNIKEEKRKYPLFNVLCSNTMLNWYYLRNIFMSLGKRFSDRIILQTSLFCVVVVIALLLSILSIFGFLSRFIATV